MDNKSFKFHCYEFRTWKNVEQVDESSHLILNNGLDYFPVRISYIFSSFHFFGSQTKEWKNLINK